MDLSPVHNQICPTCTHHKDLTHKVVLDYVGPSLKERHLLVCPMSCERVAKATKALESLGAAT